MEHRSSPLQPHSLQSTSRLSCLRRVASIHVPTQLGVYGPEQGILSSSSIPHSLRRSSSLSRLVARDLVYVCPNMFSNMPPISQSHYPLPVSCSLILLEARRLWILASRSLLLAPGPNPFTPPSLVELARPTQFWEAAMCLVRLNFTATQGFVGSVLHLKSKPACLDDSSFPCPPSAQGLLA